MNCRASVSCGKILSDPIVTNQNPKRRREEWKKNIWRNNGQNFPNLRKTTNPQIQEV